MAHQWNTRDDLALFWGCVLVGILLVTAGCLPVDLLRYDSLARERIDADIGARATCAAGELSGIADADPDRALELAAPLCALRQIEDLARSGVHRAQTAQLLWSADHETQVVIGSPADDRQVVTLAGRSLEANRKRWWNRAAAATAAAVQSFAGALARAIVIEVPRAIIPWWMWPGIVAAALVALAGFGWAGYQRWVVLPRLRTRQACAEAEHAEAIAAKDRAIDQFDEAIERLPPEDRHAIGKGPDLQAEHIRRNERRKERLDSILPVQERDNDSVLRAIGEEARTRETDRGAQTIPVERECSDAGEQFRIKDTGTGG